MDKPDEVHAIIRDMVDSREGNTEAESEEENDNKVVSGIYLFYLPPADRLLRLTLHAGPQGDKY